MKNLLYGEENDKNIMKEWFDEHDKQIRLEILNPIAKLIDDFACEREETVLQAISEYIYEQTKR